VARAQFWALRENTKWTRTEIKTKWPFDAIKSRWPANADDPVWMTALTPSAFDRPLADRWAHTWEVVGLGSAKREARRLFGRLEEQTRTESARKKLLATDEKTLVLDLATRWETILKDETMRLCTSIQQNSVGEALSRTYGASITAAVCAETRISHIRTVVGRIKAGADPIDAVTNELREAREQVAKSVHAQLTGYRTQIDAFVGLLRNHGVGLFIAEGENLLREVAAAREAKRLQAEIDKVHRTAPQTSSSAT
jgi:hypothetical protein